MIKTGNTAAVAVIALVSLLGTPRTSADTIHSEFRETVVTQGPQGYIRRVTPDFITVVEPRHIDIDLSRLPKKTPWKPGDPIVSIPRHRGEPRISNPRAVNKTSALDPLLARQAGIQPRTGRGVSGFTTPILNFEGMRSGSNPHDANGDVGINYFVQAINGPGGTQYTFHNKADGKVAAGPFTLEDLDGGNCDGRGDPIVIFDEIAGRWMLTEFSQTGDRELCVYVAQSADPIAGGYFAYKFQVPFFPDYPKYGVWPDAYYVGANELDFGGNSSSLYALHRAEMLAGNPATLQRFKIDDPAAFGFAMIPPVDHDGTIAPPGGEPGIFIRHFDDEAHDPNNNDPKTDLLQIWEFDVDWVTPANSALTGPIDIEITEFDSDQCGYTTFECYPQPGTNVGLDSLREVIMNLPKYRNFGAYEVIVGNLPTDVDGTDHGGVRWFELRRSSSRGSPGPWALYQEGTYAPDVDDGEGAVEHHWLAGSAMDQAGNIAIGFNVTNDTNIFPSITYDGRLASDPLGVLTAGATTIIDGTASHTSSNRWGDYSSMSVDPVDGCTFWFTSNYGSTDSAPTASSRIAKFRFDSCDDPFFTLDADIYQLDACVAGGADPLEEITLSVGSAFGFSNDVSLSFNPALPAGLMGSITPDVVTPAEPASTAAVNLTAEDTAIPGDYIVTIEGAAELTDPRMVEIAINIADAIPASPALTMPPDDETGVKTLPTFSWSAVEQADSYVIEVATNLGFGNVLVNDIANGTSYIPDSGLPIGTELFWRVTATNQCGPGSTSAIFSFTTDEIGFIHGFESP